MKLLKHFIIDVVLSAAILYVIAYYVPGLGLQITSEYKDTFVVFGVLGLFLRVITFLLKKIIKILALPAKYITLGLSSLIINILMFYVFEQFIAYLDVGIQVHLGTITQTAVLAAIITALYFLVKKLI